MQGVIERRRAYLGLIRILTLEKGWFTIGDLAKEASIPRSTARDWIMRLSEEGCVVVREEPHGRSPAQYAAVSAIPRTACRRIFTTLDQGVVEVVHECLSSSCAAFCGFHHGIGQENITVCRDGTLLREFIPLGGSEREVGLLPLPAVAVIRVWQEGGDIIQQIRSIGGPAYSLSGMMGRAEGVIDISVHRDGGCTEGYLRTRALVHMIIGVDDTDSPDGGATFALTIALLQHLSALSGVFPICHRVIMLYPEIEGKTAGNSCSSIEIAVPPEMVHQISGECLRFVSDESISPGWGIAIKQGFIIDPDLFGYGKKVRMRQVSLEETRECAARHEIFMGGGAGRIGALAAISLSRLPIESQLNPFQAISE